ncbi:DMT family transporter [Roseibium aggregatum]|uniref:DMT family transporter n=1 Tax=Roseibium aggregatum TaxID=187304 RepID=A0A939J3Y7_9HYPH|nr:DMT family transporter [Roseibium aggregatum]MBN9670139.1 DMT family transporter [Roseibium aggregatum]
MPRTEFNPLAIFKRENDRSLGSDAAKLLENPFVLLMVVGGLLAVATVFAKAAPAVGWHPLALLQWSVLGGAGALFAVTSMFGARKDTEDRKSAPGWKGRMMLYLTVSGLLFIAPNMIAVVAASKVGAGFVALSYAFPLVLTYGFAVFLRLERFQIVRAAGVVFGLAGGLLLALSGAKLSGEASLWSLIAMAIPVFLAVGNIYRTVQWPENARPVDLALGMMLVGFLGLAVFNGLMGIPERPLVWNREAVGLLAAQIVVFTLQYGLYFRLQKTAGPVYLSQIGSVAAVTGLGLGYLVFSEVPGLGQLMAVLAVGAGIVLVTLGRRRL